jgi:hypothetical protein
MKLRIKGNSIRIRLSRSEVDSFATGGYLEEKTEFGNSELIYALQAKDGIPMLEAGFSGNKITLYVSSAIPAQWAANEVVGYDYYMDTGNNRQLYLLLEKDFKCIDAQTNEDQSDNFENPRKVC